MVLKIESFDTFSSFDNLKASFHCTHLSKKFQVFAAVHKSNVFSSAAKILLSNLSPNLSAYNHQACLIVMPNRSLSSYKGSSLCF